MHILFTFMQHRVALHKSLFNLIKSTRINIYTLTANTQAVIHHQVNNQVQHKKSNPFERHMIVFLKEIMRSVFAFASQHEKSNQTKDHLLLLLC